MPGPRAGWLYLKDPDGQAQEIFNDARLASYLKNPALSSGLGVDICSVLDLGGCPTYAYAPPICEGDTDANHMLLPASQTGPNLVHVPDAANLSAPAQLDLRFVIDNVATGSTTRTIMCHTGTSSISWILQLSTTDALQLLTSTNGTSTTTATCDVALTTSDEATVGRVTWQSSDGRVRFFHKPVDGDLAEIDTVMASNSDWLQIGGDEVASTGGLFNSTSPVRVGNASTTATSNPYVGKIYAVSMATTIDAAPVLNISTHDWPQIETVIVAGDGLLLESGDEPLLETGDAWLLEAGAFIGSSTFVVATGQVATVVRADAGPVLSFVFDEADGWEALSFLSPAQDPAPWYDAAYPHSADALGFFVEEWTGLDDSHFSRPVAPLRYGGQLGSLAAKDRTMKLNVVAFARTEAAMVYLYRWLEAAFSSSCAPCDTDSVLIRQFCTDSDAMWDGVVELRKVGLVEGLTWESEVLDQGRCFVRRLSFTLAAGDPCMYHAGTTVPFDPSDAADVDDCLGNLALNEDRPYCRPGCTDLVSTCRSSFTFSLTRLRAAPIITLTNDSDSPVIPLRVSVLADPLDVGLTPNPCGLTIVGQLYLRPLPPRSELVWDVLGRDVTYRDNSTGVHVSGFAYVDANDPPYRRWFTLGCGTHHVIVEPASLCLEVDATNSRYLYGGHAFYWADLHYPTLGLEVAEKSGCP